MVCVKAMDPRLRGDDDCFASSLIPPDPMRVRGDDESESARTSAVGEAGNEDTRRRAAASDSFAIVYE